MRTLRDAQLSYIRDMSKATGRHHYTALGGLKVLVSNWSSPLLLVGV